MPHFCMFGSNEVQLEPDPPPCFTFFGGSELRRPPLAVKIASYRARGPAAVPREHWVITLFGGTELQWPTLADEYVALRSALEAGTVTLADWDRFTTSPAATDMGRLRSFTIFGGLSADEVPSEEQEIDSLSTQRHLGHLSQRAAEILMLAVGQRGMVRLSAVRRAAADTMNER